MRKNHRRNNSHPPEDPAAVRLGPLRQGLCARSAVLPGESQSEFDRLCDGLEAEWQPRTHTEQFLLEQMAVSQWKMARLERDEMALIAHNTVADRIPLLDRLSKIHARLERWYFRAYRELERLIRLRRKDDAGAPEEKKSAEPEKPLPTALIWEDYPEKGKKTVVAAPPGFTRKDFPGYEFTNNIPE
jgi:hypothetical protein